MDPRTHIAPATDSDEAYFRQTPWCRKYLDDPTWIRLAKLSRDEPDRGSRAGTLFGKTLNTPDTFAAGMSMFKLVPPTSTLDEETSPSKRATEAITLIALGSGLNGHPDTAHGGTVATILDQCAGMMLRVGQEPGGAERLPIFTAYLNVTYLAPVRTPQVVCVQSKIVEVTGRKKRIFVEILERGEVPLARADALFVKVRGNGGKEGGEKGKL